MSIQSEKELFANRHLGSGPAEIKSMLETIGFESVAELIKKTVPASILMENLLELPPAMTEAEFLTELQSLSESNTLFDNFIGQGYYNTITPTVILRNILENPGWYTAYTPYQAEIAQGRLEALINFQTMVSDLTGLEIANASLLDEGTAAAEAMHMFFATRPSDKRNALKFFVSELCHPQTIEVLITRSAPLGIELVVGSHEEIIFTDSEIFGILLQYPASNGTILDYSQTIAAAKENNVFVALATDLLALTLLTPPGELGADVALGSSQRFGVPLGFGGPHAAFFATRETFKRVLPGRIIGLSQDAHGNRAYRMALQTREQHIRREKATSNICTAQVLLAVIAGAYAVYHGPKGLTRIAEQIHAKAVLLALYLSDYGFDELNGNFFDTVRFKVDDVENLLSVAEFQSFNFRYYENGEVSISIGENTTVEDIEWIVKVFLESQEIENKMEPGEEEFTAPSLIPDELKRTTPFLQHPVFNSYHTEHEMLRYLKHLENKDLSLVHSMIPLGSCTMKLNATTEMIPVTWPQFGNIHPFAPVGQTEAYQTIFEELSAWLAEITGFAAVSFQPNSGAQGEYAGLMVIRAFHEAQGNSNRNIALIPQSAHGTNPASAVMAGMKVVVTKCDEKGNIDLADLQANAEKYADNLACLMVTYPSTHGVYEESIHEICSIIHNHGGQVYMDGANMNAQVGLTSPGRIGADVCHLNLHKTFCIPHGGGGPGMGPICVAAHLAPFLPGHCEVETGGTDGITAVSSAPYGSASILLISYAYISLMGAEGLRQASEMAILNANYIKARLEKHYPLLYTGNNGTCAHEFILDCRPFKQSAGVEVEDVAKRLMDYGFHAPTVSFPVAGTLMIEPTESESKAELDRFCDAMIAIRHEIAEIENDQADRLNNVLKNAPHTAQIITADEWAYPYGRQKAAYPLPYLKANKFWPSVSRIDGAFGDRNLVCTCPPVEEYGSLEV